MSSISVVKRKVAAGLLIGLAGTGVALAALESGKEANEALANPVLSAQDVDDLAKGLALTRWHDYMRRIGWHEHLVQATHPDFVDVITSKTAHADGGWTIVFDGTRPGELRKVTMRLDAQGNEVGETLVEWGDMCTVEDIEGVCR